MGNHRARYKRIEATVRWAITALEESVPGSLVVAALKAALKKPPPTAETRAKIAVARKGTKRSEATRQKMSESLRARNRRARVLKAMEIQQ